MTVSVVIPAYNAASFLAETIASAVAQTYAAHEIIVVDDGSTDATVAVAEACGARVIRQENGGVCAARNAGILAATGEWIALLDHDDLWTKGKLERQLAAATLRPDVACIATDFLRLRDGELDPVSCLEDTTYDVSKLTTVTIAPDTLYFPRAGEEVLDAGWFLFPSSMLIKRELLIAVGMFRPEQRLCEDVDCFLRVLHRTPLILIVDPLWYWREHATNTSQNSRGIAEGWLRMAEYVGTTPGDYPPGTLNRIQPILRTVRRGLVTEYTSDGDFRSARRVARSAIGGPLTPTDAALAVVVELPPKVWGALRRAKRAIRSFFS